MATLPAPGDPTARRATLVVLLATGLAFLSAGTLLLNASWTWTVVYTYDVSVEVIGGEPNASWTVWVPRPEAPLPVVNRSGDVQSRGAVQTAHGLLENLTGRGSARVGYLLRQTVHAPATYPVRMNLSAADWRAYARGYWVWRDSENASQVFSVIGFAWARAEHLEESSAQCLASFLGPAAEEWSLLPRPFCEGGYRGGLVPWEALGYGFVVGGMALFIGGVAVWARTKERRDRRSSLSNRPRR